MSSKSKVCWITLLLLQAPLFAMDDSFQLVKAGEKVNVYGPKRDRCDGDGSSVIFVIENKTKNRLQLKMEILNEKVKNKLTVVVEPTGNTSVLSLAPNMETCHVQLVDMQVKELVPPSIAPAVSAPAVSAPGVWAPTGAALDGATLNPALPPTTTAKAGP